MYLFVLCRKTSTNLNFFNEFHRHARLPKGISAPFLALIPKTSNPQGLGEYRPISLIGCLYKMLSKVLAGRFKKVLKCVISSVQSAFLTGRNILDGVVVVNEVMDMAKRQRKKCVILKADFEKAYDSVSWSYLDYMLDRLGFGVKWRGWMRTCFSSNSISILVNGSPTEEFVAQKGLKQGDPLAPFLFLVAAEGLAGLVRRGVESNNLNGFKLSESLSVELLQFADDTIFFCDGGDRSVWCLKAILRSFELVSGLKVNFAKSNVIGINMEERTMEGISQFLSCRLGSMSFKFLGVPVGANPRLRSTWQPIIDSIKARLNSWKSRQLSIGGRVTLINSVLASLPLFLFSFYKAPKKVIEEIIKLQRRFLWGGDGENKKMAWVSWDTICISKEKGGLGIKNLEAFNLALLIKWRWRILVEEGNSLWKDILVERYGLKGRWPRAQDFGREWGKTSIWWRDLCLLGDGTNLVNGWFDDIVKIKVGRGNMVQFWNDKWLGRECFAELFPTIYSSCNIKDAVVEEMGSWSGEVWQWNWEWAAELLPNE